MVKNREEDASRNPGRTDQPNSPAGSRDGSGKKRPVVAASDLRVSRGGKEILHGLDLNLEPGTLRIASSNAEQEEAVDELDIDYGGDAIEIGFNVTYLMDVLSTLKQQEMITIGLQDANSSALITLPGDDNFKYVVMPMRI